MQCFYSFREEELGEATQVYWKTDSNVIYQADGSKSFNFGKLIIASKVSLCQAWWSIILALRRLRQENQEDKASGLHCKTLSQKNKHK
jgi:hypothetical protein